MVETPLNTMPDRCVLVKYEAEEEQDEFDVIEEADLQTIPEKEEETIDIPVDADQTSDGDDDKESEPEDEA